jgi:TolB-like protein
MGSLKAFIAELQRRHVIRAAVAHIIVFWLLIQVADVVLPYIGIVDEPVRWALIAGVALFPITLIVAWFFEHPWQKHTRSRLAADVIIILVVVVTAGSWVLRNIPQVVHTRTSIVILPFEHSGDPLEQSLSRALAYEVNSLLMKSRSIDVIGFESAVSTVLEGLDPPGVAARLQVQHVLSGNISAANNVMRIDLRLLDSAGRALWEHVIEESLDQLFDVQESIALAVESRLGAGEEAVPVQVVAAERCPMPSDPLALEKYYTARYYIELRTESETSRQQIRDAIALYEELIDAYPDFAEAYAGLAWAYAHQPSYDPRHARSDWREVGVELAQKGLEYCPTLTEAIHHTANEYDHPNPWIGAYQQLTAFIELEPQRAENYQRLSRHFRETGLVDRALEVAEHNFAMNPLSPKAAKILSAVYQYAERYDEAIELADLAADLGNTGPNFARDNRAMAACGDDLDCILDRLPPMMQGFQEAFRQIYSEPTSPEDAREAIDLALELNAQTSGNLVNWFNASLCRYEHLTPLFFEIWEQNEELGGYWFWPNVWLPRCGNVWSDPRFPEFVERFGLVEYWHKAGWPAMCRPEGDGVVCGEPANL